MTPASLDECYSTGEPNRSRLYF